MGSLTLSITYAKNTGLVYNSTELKNLYFTGIDLKDQYGNPIPEDTINFYIEAAQKELADYLEVKLTRQAIMENKDFNRDDFVAWNYIPVSYPAVKALSVKGYLNTSLQINYPKEWLSTKNDSNPDSYWRDIQLVAINGSAQLSSSAIFIGLTPYMGFFGNRIIPNYWTCIYQSGWLKIPADILAYIGKMASINILLMLQDILFGLGSGTSSSLAIDGLSESKGGRPNGIFGPRIAQYQKDMQISLERMVPKYRGILIGAL